MSAFVYAIECRDGSLYIGHTYNLDQRMAAHRAGHVRWTRARQPLTLVYQEECEDQMMAIKRERELKAGCGREELKVAIREGRPACRQAGKTVGAGVITEIVK